jgi:hypothetical protein
MEILGFNFHNEREKNFIEEILALFSVIHTNQGIAAKVIEIRKNYKIKLPDAIIAATALTENLSLVTRNIDDFQNIDNLELINPFDESQI